MIDDTCDAMTTIYLGIQPLVVTGHGTVWYRTVYFREAREAREGRGLKVRESQQPHFLSPGGAQTDRETERDRARSGGG